MLLSLLLASVVMGASAIYLERKKLLSLADGAALAAADSYTAGDIGGGSGTPSTSLVDGRVLAATGSYLDASNAFSRHDQLAVAAGGTGSEPGGYRGGSPHCRGASADGQLPTPRRDSH